MFFSKHNEEIVYINHYSGLLEVEGKGAVSREDARVWPVSDEDWAGDYHTLSITEGITGLGEGYLDAFPSLRCLILARTVVSVAVTPAVSKLLRKNKVLIRGEYDTFAEEFAKKEKLGFLHSDIPLAVDEDEKHHEHDIITLRFHPDGAPDIHYNCFTPGSSAGSFGGGEYANELPQDFYVGCTMEAFTGNFPEHLRDQPTSNDMLRRFLKAANRRHAQE